MEYTKLFIVFIIALSIYINVRIVSYLYNLEDKNCSCALLTERKYIIFYTLYSIILTFIFTGISIFKPELILSSDLYGMTVVNKFLSFINVIVTIYYLNKLRYCPCSVSSTKDIMFYMAFGGIFVYIINIIFGRC